MTNSVNPGYTSSQKHTCIFSQCSKVALVKYQWTSKSGLFLQTEVKRRVTRKLVFSRPLVYTLSNNTLFNIGVNPDVKIDVKFGANVKECVVSKGRSKSARIGPVSRSGYNVAPVLLLCNGHKSMVMCNVQWL